LFTSVDEQNSAKNQTNDDFTQSLMEQNLPAVMNNLPEEECSTNTLKLISAKIPENNCNTIIPLKVTRTLKAPKLKPNLLHRIHRVEKSKAPETLPPTVLKNTADCGVSYQILIPDVMIEEEAPKINNYKSEDFRGFPENIGKNYDVSLWSSVLCHENDAIEPKENEKVVEKMKKALVKNKYSSVNDQEKRSSSTNHVKERLPQERSEIVTNSKHLTPKHAPSKIAIKSVENIMPPTITSTPYTTKHFASTSKACSSLSLKSLVPSSNVTKDKSQAVIHPVNSVSTPEKSSPFQFKPFSSTPKPVPLQLSPDPPHMKSPLALAKQVPVPSKIFSTTSSSKPNPPSPKSLPSTSKKLSDTETQPEANEDWMEDILTVIGESRIAKIDESLKEIPSLITGNFNEIETENVEFKLIIKHLLREMGVQSILDTVKFLAQENSSSMSIDKGLICYSLIVPN
jgi:hypothetical protein